MKRQYLKMSATVIFAILLMFSLPSCSSDQPQEETAEGSLMEKLAALDGVKSIEKVDGNQSKWLIDKYVLMIEQQIDWTDPSAGTFLQQVEVGIHPDAEVNVLETYGYPFLDGDLTADNQPEVCVILNANHIKVEHRFSEYHFPKG